MRKIRVRVSGGVPYTPLVQWIERETSKLMMRVQFLQGVPIWRSGRAWLNALDLKSSDRETDPWVRILPSPPISVSSNGRTAVSKTVYLGSNPSTGANSWVAKWKGRALQPLDRRFNPDPNFHVNILIYKKEKLL